MKAAETLRELAGAATPGPWHSHISMRPYTVYGPDDNDLARAWDDADAAYIAAMSPDFALRLADLIDAAEDVDGEYHGRSRGWHKHLHAALAALESLT